MLARLIRLVALLLLAGQAIVVQAHGHATPWGGAPTVQATAHTAPASGDRDDPLRCPVCREVAHAGPYLSAAGVALAVPAAAERWSPDIVPAVRAQATVSHSWRSRAPPVSLHA